MHEAHQYRKSVISDLLILALQVSQFDQVPPSNTIITGIEIGNNSLTVPSLILGTTIIEPGEQIVIG